MALPRLVNAEGASHRPSQSLQVMGRLSADGVQPLQRTEDLSAGAVQRLQRAGGLSAGALQPLPRLAGLSGRPVQRFAPGQEPTTGFG